MEIGEKGTLVFIPSPLLIMIQSLFHDLLLTSKLLQSLFPLASSTFVRRRLCWFPLHEACLGVLLLPPGRDTSPSQGCPQQYDAGTHLYTWVKRDKVEYSSLSKETTRRARLEPQTSRSLQIQSSRC